MYSNNALVATILVIFLLIETTLAKIKPDQQICSYHLFSNDSSIHDIKKYQLYDKYCFNIPLPYRTVTLPSYVPGRDNFTNPEEVHNLMELSLKSVRFLPKCWPKYQILFCSIFYPRYDEEYATGRHRISRPNTEICHDVVRSGDCEFIGRHFGWHSIFHCNDTKLYATKCNNELDVGPSYVAETCPYPLVPSTNNNSWFKDIEGCSLHCKHPILNLDNQRLINTYLIILILIGFFSSTIALVLFEVKKSNENITTIQAYSIEEIIKKCNRCKFIEHIGWSLQIFFNVTCDSRGSKLDGYTCLISFFLTYTSQLTCLFWLVYFSIVCYEKLTGDKGTPKSAQRLNSFYWMSYAVPVALSIVVAVMKQIDGNGIYGLCTVGGQSVMVKILFDFIPTAIGVACADIHFFQTCTKILRISKKEEIDKHPEKRNLYITNFMKFTALAITSTLDIVLRAALYFYVTVEHSGWEQSIDEYIACNLDIRQLYDSYAIQSDSCSLSANYLIIVLYYLELFTKLAPGCIIASWALERSHSRETSSRLEEYREIACIDDTNGQSNGIDMETQMRSSRMGSLGSTALSEHLQGEIDKRYWYEGRTPRDILNEIKYRNGLIPNQPVNMNEIPNQDELQKMVLMTMPQLPAELQKMMEDLVNMQQPSPDRSQSTDSEPQFTLGIHKSEDQKRG